MAPTYMPSEYVVQHILRCKEVTYATSWQRVGFATTQTRSMYKYKALGLKIVLASVGADNNYLFLYQINTKIVLPFIGAEIIIFFISNK